ncbi:MAG: TetR-like C-terminal domain-containing protein, partial [Eubacteriales bacterium]|nr:TetR-like C-terminal domain-containing protein [Eubacteriales bacterium]
KQHLLISYLDSTIMGKDEWFNQQCLAIRNLLNTSVECVYELSEFKKLTEAMKMGLDARVRYTKMVIQVNFVTLLKQKPINKITVKEICDMAEINRATFYKYYADAYELMEKMEEQILSELQAVMQESIKEGVEMTLIRILEKMKEDGELYIALFSGNGDTTFPMKIFRMCYAEFEEFIHKKYPRLSEKQRAWIYVYTAQGSSGILNYWISDGMQESAKEIAEFINQLIDSTLKNL